MKKPELIRHLDRYLPWLVAFIVLSAGVGVGLFFLLRQWFEPQEAVWFALAGVGAGWIRRCSRVGT